jgi:hypothetical protein
MKKWNSALRVWVAANRTRYIARLKTWRGFVPLMGLCALIWFLIRVIPKPSRATYPCQRAAFPLASATVIWALGLWASTRVMHRPWLRGMRRHNTIALGGFVASLALVLTSFVAPANMAVAGDSVPFVPSDGPNEPMGVARGIQAGRVAWVHDPLASRWDGESGYWWQEENTDAGRVATMVSQALRTLTGRASDAAAWDALFRSFNQRRGLGDRGYQPGETIVVKLNLNQVGSYLHPGNSLFPAPQTVLALVRQLVNEAGIPAAQICFYDVTRYVPAVLFDPVHAEYPEVRFIDWAGERGRQQYVRDEEVQIHWSEDMTLEKAGGNPTYLPTCVTQSDYLINLANIKGHSLAGVTMTAKNHFGSLSADRQDLGGVPWQSAPQAAGLHPYVAVHDFNLGNPTWESYERPLASYNPIVDLMGHKHLGEKTLLFFIDGLYATPEQNGELKNQHRWMMEPFNDHWTASLFMSQDGVAIESVGLDFLRTEPTMVQVYGSVDNYLHEAAQANDPPSGAFYDPEGDGVRLESLGVHEHWNNAADKQYSGNLGREGGIELVTPQVLTAVVEETGALPQALALGNYPNPFNAATTLSFTVPQDGLGRLEIFDALGQSVAVLLEGTVVAGPHALSWHGRDGQRRALATGIYWARLSVGAEQVVHKVALLR